MANQWKTSKPPNDTLVEVEHQGQVIRVKAFFGREGYHPYWQSEDGASSWHTSCFTRWREIAKPLPTAEENAGGLHQKYVISRADGKPVDADAVYFVLRLDGDHLHNKASRSAAMRWCLEVFSNPDGPLTQTAKELVEMIREITKRD